MGNMVDNIGTVNPNFQISNEMRSSQSLLTTINLIFFYECNFTQDE